MHPSTVNKVIVNLSVSYGLVTQSRVEKSREDGEKAIGMINELSLFSENEEMEEVATADMK